MNEMLVRSRALRVAGFGLTLMAGATLSACGGDNNNDGGGGGGGGGSVGTADLTAAGAKAQVGTFGQMIQALGALDSLNNTAPVAAAPRNKPLGKHSTVRSKASEACPDGGTIESTGPTSKNVGSPFTDMSMSVSGEDPAMPALRKATSTRPYARIASSARCCTEARSATSHGTPRTS